MATVPLILRAFLTYGRIEGEKSTAGTRAPAPLAPRPLTLPPDRAKSVGVRNRSAMNFHQTRDTTAIVLPFNTGTVTAT